MNKNYELIKKIIEDGKYKVLEDDGEHITIRYQLNVLHISPSQGDDNFVSVLLPSLLCRAAFLEDDHDIVLHLKLYTINDVIIAASEFFYMEEDDLAYQFKMSLSSVIAAKVNYRKFES